MLSLSAVATAREADHWPLDFELNIGDTATVACPTDDAAVSREVRLLAVRELHEPDYWIDEDGGETIRGAEVDVEVGGVPATLLCRPYQMPVDVNGLRIYVEMTRDWANTGAFSRHRLNYDHDVRFSAVAAGQPWGPTEFRFPIRDYRWRSSSYNNTWSSLVPYNVLYYHRGDDLGAIPDRLGVVAPLDGVIIASPPPQGDGGVNLIAIQTPGGSRIVFAHCDIDTVRPEIKKEHVVRPGDPLARTGMTYSGKRAQYNDPHLHVGMTVHGKAASPYPYLVESYLRDYPDGALAVAGGYYFTVPGRSIQLDATRSIARPGRKITSFEWRLHDGRTSHGPLLTTTYDQPGLYCEELRIKTDAGYETRDFAQVRVYDPNKPKDVDIVAGWIHYSPVRGIKPGDPVTIWPRLFRKTSPVVAIDFGDGQTESAIGQEVVHRYDAPGTYTVTISTTQPGGMPVATKTRVVVEP